MLIANVVRVSVDPNANEPNTRAFVNVSLGKGQGRFKPVLQALSDEDERQIVLENAKREAKAFAEKYATLSELAKVIAAINEL